LTLAPHQLEHLLERGVEAVLVVAVHRRHRGVVELGELLARAVGHAVLALGGDADDHAWRSCWEDCSGSSTVPSASPAPSSPAGAAMPSSAFILARSSSTWLWDVSSCSWRSMSS